MVDVKERGERLQSTKSCWTLRSRQFSQCPEPPCPTVLTTSKLAVFEEIALDARRAIIEHRAGIPDGTVISHTAGLPTNDRFRVPDQMRGLDSSSSAPAPIQQAGSAEMARRAAGSGVGSPGAPGMDKQEEDDVARRQREFDELLERERKGGEETKRW